MNDQAIPVWPATVRAQVQDNLGLASVTCESWLNGERQEDFELMLLGEYIFEGEFVSSVMEGDSIRYRIVATDAAQAANQAAHPSIGEHAFAIRGEGGLVLLLEDGESFCGSGGKPGPNKEWMPAAPKGERSASADWIEEALLDAGYLVQRETLGLSDPALWTAYDLLVICSSDREDPLSVDGIPAALESYAAGGGRLICEGGELAYKFREDSSFLNTVLHASGWLSDYGGNLELSAPNHAVANYPYELPGTIPFNYQHYTDQDLIAPAPDATLVFGTNINEFAAGVVVHDMDPDPLGGQSVFLPFNLGRIGQTEAKHLIRNAAAWLLTGFTGGNGQVSGSVFLSDQGDHSGVLVTLTDQEPWVTGPDGGFQFEGVWTGNVLLHAEKYGYSDVDSVLTLTDGQVIDGIILELQPIIVIDYSAQPELLIPDNYAVGVSDTIWVNEVGSILDLNVDVNLSHSYIGDLMLKLVSPAGTSVLLHNRSGGSSDNIIGNYPLTLVPVDDLDELRGETINGPWVFHVSDHAQEDLGTLHSWGLHISVPSQPTEVGETPAIFRLRGNWPNPFNPSTRLEFNLAEPGRTMLEIFDLRGRRLALLRDENLAAGTYSVVWHGTDQKGRALSSGVYFARLRSGEMEAVHKMLLLK
ncbi:proprotein convertase P-domain-containing protein [bacterium]|nr:proprotein convertase P-domain-containing protein [bacterium]